ncbi:MAG: hypothetical protein KBD31_00235 [Proteobacteria bacterium]|nr:hypothetical protein [Pseudomonadota bacterium]
MKFRSRFFKIKAFILKMAITASAMSNPLQPVVETDSTKSSQTVVRLRRRFGEFNQQDIMNAVKFSKSVYFWNDEKDQYTSIHQHEDRSYGIFYSIVKKDDKYYVGFRGSDNMSNFLMDLWCNWARDKNRENFYHNGMLKIFSSLQKNLTNALKKIALDKGESFDCFLNESVYFTGHSLGGALAILGTHSFLKDYNAKIKTICFATPHVMDVLSANALNKAMSDKIINFQQDYDPIPEVFNFGHYAVNKVNDYLKSFFSTENPALDMSILFKYFSYFFTHPAAHPGQIVKVPYLGSMLNVATAHKINSYIHVLSAYFKGEINELDSYFSPETLSFHADMVISCNVRRKMHHMIDSLLKPLDFYGSFKQFVFP